MGSLSGLLNSARNALLSDQLAINTTAQNIANQNTVGYARRVVNWSENDTVQINGVNAGRGATASVSSTRDTVLDRSVQQATDIAAASSTRVTALQSTQALFALDSSGNDSSGVNVALSGFFSSVSGWASDPTSSSARALTLSAAGTVASTFRRTSASLSAQQQSLNNKVNADVTSANQLLSQIATLDGQIASLGKDAASSSLLDQRTLAVEQLSQYIDVQHVTGENNSLTLSTSEGTLLVSGDKPYALTTGDLNGVTHVFASASQGSTDITSAISGGSIGGAIQVRDHDIPAVQQQIDQLAYSFATAVNTQNQAGKDANGDTGTAVFNVGTTAAGAAANLTIALADPNGLAAATTTQGSGGSGNASALLALQNAHLTNGKTFAGAFSAALSTLGASITSAQSDSTADTAILSQLTTQRDSVTGVSLDQEAANLTQYQRSYQAAAKLMSILNELLATAINLGTNTPVS